MVFGSICKTFASFRHILWPSSYICWANFDFLFPNRNWVRLYLCFLMRTSKGLLPSNSYPHNLSFYDPIHSFLPPSYRLQSGPFTRRILTKIGMHTLSPRPSRMYYPSRHIDVTESYPCNRPWRPMGVWDVEAPTFFLDNRLTDGGKVVSLKLLPPFTSPPGRFLVLISVRGWVDPRAIVWLEELGQLRNPPHRDSNSLPPGL
jgi:hypothetical protein